MPYKLILLLWVLSLRCFGQDVTSAELPYQPKGGSGLQFCGSKEAAIVIAEEDIKKGTPSLLLASGFAPIVYVADAKFEKKYHVSYYDFGCTSPETAYLEAYNSRIFSYLTEQYGIKWRRMIRKDVIGLEKEK